MSHFIMNSLVDRAQVLDCYLELASGGNFYRLKSLQDFDPKFSFPYIERVADDGTFYLNDTISKHQVDFLLRLTADEVDTANPATNVNTVSYYLQQKNLRNHVIINVSVVYYFKDTASNKYARLNMALSLTDFGVPRILDEGDAGLPISARVILNDPVSGADISPTFIRSSS